MPRLWGVKHGYAAQQNASGSAPSGLKFPQVLIIYGSPISCFAFVKERAHQKDANLDNPDRLSLRVALGLGARMKATTSVFPVWTEQLRRVCRKIREPRASAVTIESRNR